MRGRPRSSGLVRMVFAVTVALAALAVPVSSGFGVQPTGIIRAGDPPVAAGKAADITVYLVQGGRLVPVVRPGLPGHPYLGITQLGVPVTSEERRKGMRTNVLREDILDVRRSGRPGEITVVVDGTVVEDGAETDDAHVWSAAALGQVACTAQAVPGVERVVMENPFDGGRISVTCEDDLLR